MSTATRSFRFLDLPKELRLMVYERFPVRTFHHKVSTWYGGNRKDVTLITRGICVQALATCHQIHSEARAILITKVCQRIPRIIVEPGAWRVLVVKFRYKGVLVALYDWLLELRQDPEADFIYWARNQDILPNELYETGQETETLRFIWQAGIVLLQHFNHTRNQPSYNPQSPVVVYTAFFMKAPQNGVYPTVVHTTGLPASFSNGMDEFGHDVYSNLCDVLDLDLAELRWFGEPLLLGSRHFIGFPLSIGSAEEIAARGLDRDAEQLWGSGWVEGEEE